MRAIDLLVRLQVSGPGLIERGLIGHCPAILQGQHAAQQMLRAAPHEAGDLLALDAGAAHLPQHGVQGGVKVAQRIDERAVAVKHDGLDGSWHRRGK